MVGMWRSGTSLLYALLNQHSQIALMYEGELPVLRPLFWKRSGLRDWLERWEFWNGALTRHKVDSSQVSDVSDLPSAVQEMYGKYASTKGASIWGDKSPNYYDSLPQLARDFSNAQFIVIWRDPADVCRSILRAAAKDSWFRKKGIPHRAIFGLHRMKMDCDRLIQSGVAIHQIDYEDLVHRPLDVMRSICEFLQIPFESRMTTLEGADRSAIYEGEHHKGVKSEKIEARQARPEVLPQSLKWKIERYVCFWSKQYDGGWPPKPSLQNESTSTTPSWLQRAADSLLFRAYRLLDSTVVVIYSFVPIALLRKYRSAKTGSIALNSEGESVQSASAND